MLRFPKLSIVQKKGQVTIPFDIRQKLGLKEGDRVAFVETEAGVLLSPQTVVDTNALEQVEAVLEQQGLTLNTFLASPFGFAHQMPTTATGTVEDGLQAVEQTFGAFAAHHQPEDFKQLRERFMEETAQTVIAQTVPPTT